MGINVNSLESLAQRVSKYAKACGVKSILQTKQPALKGVNISKLKFAGKLENDTVQISQKVPEIITPKGNFNFDLSHSKDELNVFHPEINNIFKNGCGRGCKQSRADVDTELFEKITGISLRVGDNKGLRPFRKGIDLILEQIEKGTFPKDIKGIVIGHGKGSSALGTWEFGGGSNIKVLDYISQNFNKGDKILCLSCETANNATSRYPGIGNTVTLTLNVSTHPAKIVESGGGIVGHFVNETSTIYDGLKKL